jgi:hypothetical protein
MNTSGKWAALEQHKMFPPPHSYAPTRRALPDILNIEMGPLAVGLRTGWEKIEDGIRRWSKHDDELDANLAVAKCLYRFAEESNISGRRSEFHPMAGAGGQPIAFWHSAVIDLGGRMVVPFIDPRLTKSLTGASRQFVFSVMHERIRLIDPDFADAELAIIQAPKDALGVRQARVHYASSSELIPFKLLNEMIQETYAIWTKINEERVAAKRKTVSAR